MSRVFHRPWSFSSIYKFNSRFKGFTRKYDNIDQNLNLGWSTKMANTTLFVYNINERQQNQLSVTVCWYLASMFKIINISRNSRLLADRILNSAKCVPNSLYFSDKPSQDSPTPPTVMSKYEPFRDDRSPIILDVEEERRKSRSMAIEEEGEEEANEFEGISPTRKLLEGCVGTYLSYRNEIVYPECAV